MSTVAAVLTAIAYGVLGLALFRLSRARHAALLGPLGWATFAAGSIGLGALADMSLRIAGDRDAAQLCGEVAAGGQLAAALLLFPVLRHLERRVAVIAGRRIRRRAARANAQVDAAYALLALAGRSLGFGHWRLAADGALTWSGQMFEIFGWPAETAPDAAQALSLYHPDDRALVEDHLAACQQDGAAFALTLRVCRPDGELRHVKLHGAGAGPGAVAGVLIDVTDRTAAAVDLREAQDAVQQARAALRARTTEDRLTGLPNRRSFEASLATEIKRALRANLPLALVLLDVDRLSHFNRSYTQDVGDVCLRHIGHALAAAPRRAGDVLARYGGGTFAVLLPLAEIEGAVLVAESLRAVVRTLAIAHAGTDPGIVTLSAGIATMPGAQDPHAASMLFSCAHGALLTAQRQGGDRVCAHEDSFADPYSPIILHEMNGQTSG